MGGCGGHGGVCTFVWVISAECALPAGWAGPNSGSDLGMCPPAAVY